MADARVVTRGGERIVSIGMYLGRDLQECASPGPAPEETARPAACLSAAPPAWPILAECLACEPRLRAWLRRRGVQAETIDDIVQGAYLRVLSAAGRTPLRNAYGYLAFAARSEIVDGLRHKVRVPIETVEAAKLTLFADDAPGPDRIAEERERLRAVERAIDRMPPMRQAVLRMRRIEGTPQRDTARALGLNEHAVEHHMRAAMRQLKRMDGEPMPEVASTEAAR